MKFEKVSRFADVDIEMPQRKTKYSAGYDMVAAEDVVIEPYFDNFYNAQMYGDTTHRTMDNLIKTFFTPSSADKDKPSYYELNEVADIIKTANARPTLVSTGMKCQLDPGYYLELSIRSSSPLKYLLVLANGVGM